MKKHLTKVAIFLLAGAVVYVAVAWGCALRTGTSSDEELLLTAAKSEWVQFIEYRRNVHPGVLTAVSCRGLDVITIEGTAVKGLTDQVVAQRCRAGWPILGMRGEKVALSKRRIKHRHEREVLCGHTNRSGAKSFLSQHSRNPALPPRLARFRLRHDLLRRDPLAAHPRPLRPPPPHPPQTWPLSGLRV